MLFHVQVETAKTFSPQKYTNLEVSVLPVFDAGSFENGISDSDDTSCSGLKNDAARAGESPIRHCR
jgi:hypothetical protein